MRIKIKEYHPLYNATENRAYKKYKKPVVYINNSLHVVQKYALMFVREHYLFWEVSFENILRYSPVLAEEYSVTWHV